MQNELPYELIIVDSSDTPLSDYPEYTDMYRQIGSKLDVKYLHTQPGLTRQRNTGIKEAGGNIVYFFDDDVILKPDFLQVMNQTFIDNPNHVGGSGLIVDDKGAHKRNQSTVKRIRKTLSNLYAFIFLLSYESEAGRFRKSGFAVRPFTSDTFKDVELLSGSNMGYRKEIFSEFTFDENLAGYALMEDTDFSRRVSRKYRLFYNPNAVVEHKRAISGRTSKYDLRKMYTLNYRYIFIKNRYKGDNLSTLAHWWAILGLIIKALLLGRKDEVRGYFHGLREFNRRKTTLLNQFTAND
jgi:GT2 family glycosyltransferase